MMEDVFHFLPWQRRQAMEWLSGRERFAHAWLIHGLAGIGKRRYALAAAASLLCEQPRHGLACGECQACRWVASGNHPDFRRVRPDSVAVQEGELIEEGEAQARKTYSREIRVDQLRALSGWFTTATHRGGWRVAVIYPAEAMNAIAANALLKVLEEPPPHTVFLLTTDAPDRLLPTIVSRCRRVPLSVPPWQIAADWLKEQGVAQPDEWLAASGGAPLRALELARSESSPCPGWLRDFLRALTQGERAADVESWSGVADALERIEPIAWIDALQRVFVDLTLTEAGLAPRYFPSEVQTLTRIAQGARAADLSDTSKWLAQQRAIASHPLSAKLFIHSVLQRCALACHPTPAASKRLN
jgi:DNA polymerase-3 subunit delta'